ncbi:MAG: glycosyltransferase family 2 protein, partial [Fervidicoccaceae archaeon]
MAEERDTCVVTATYKRAWALPYSIGSLKRQSLLPSKVIFVLKPSGDESEEVIEKEAQGLNYEIVLQKSGNFVEAVELGIKACGGHSLILFIDDDAIASENWIEKYVQFFNLRKDAGGAGGAVYKAIFDGDDISPTGDHFYGRDTYKTKGGIHRRPLPEYEDYCEWLSTSGLPGGKECQGDAILSTLLSGVNMAFRGDAIFDCPLSR